MTTYWIDGNRGNDGRSGTAATESWRSLEKLESVRWAPGDSVLLADDSEWYLDRRITLRTCNGTSDRPIVFDRFNPKSGSSISFPVLRSRYAPQAKNWLFDSGIGAWFLPDPSGAKVNDVQGTGVILLGPSKEHGTFVRRFRSPNTLLTAPGQWTMHQESGRYYLYAPRTTNPTDFYGGVLIGIPAEASPALMFLRCGSHVHVRNLKFQECGNGVTVGLYMGAKSDVDGFRMYNCAAYNVGTLTRLVADHKAGEFEFVHTNSVIEGNRIERCATAGIRLLNVADVSIHNNFGDEATGRSWAIGFVYVDSANDHPRTGGGTIHGNRFSRAAHATEFVGSDNPFDGAAIYCEAGSRGLVVHGNVVTDCHTAFQDNSGRSPGNTWSANTVDRCGRGIVISDADEIGTGSTRFLNNLCVLNGGDLTMAAAPGTRGQTRRAAYFGGNGNDRAIFANNIFFSRKPAQFGVQTKPTLETVLSNNIIYGFRVPYADLAGAKLALDSTNKLSDPEFVNTARPELGLRATSPAIAAGRRVDGVLDILGREFGEIPNIGPWAVVPK